MRVFKVIGITCALLLIGAVGWQMISGMIRSKIHQENRNLVKTDLTYLHEEFEKLDPTTIEVITIDGFVRSWTPTPPRQTPDPSPAPDGATDSSR